MFGGKIGKLALLFVVPLMAEEPSSSSYLALSDSLANDLRSVAKDGFINGFEIASFFLLGMAGIVVFCHLINRGAGR